MLDHAGTPHLMLGDGGTDRRYLGSGDEDGLASMDLGTSTEAMEGFGTSCRGSARGAGSEWAAAGVVTVLAPLCAVLGSRPDMVTVVSTPPPQEARPEGPSRVEGSGWLSPGGPGGHFLSKGASKAPPGSGSEATSGTVSGTSSSAELTAGSEGGGLSCLGFGSSFLEADGFCLFGAGSSSDDGT